jgi:hypothetical protein
MNVTAMLFLILALLPLQPALPHSANQAHPEHTPVFDQTADQALSAMRARADSLKIGGVALVAYMPGETLQAWTSKMVVVGRYKDLPTATDKGANLLGIAYAKASEMADTLKDSGSQTRPPMTGEFGWQGGAIAHVKDGYIIAAFSGGKSADDLDISRTGLAKLKTFFPPADDPPPPGK